MFIRNALLTAATVVGLSGGAAMAASFDAHSFYGGDGNLRNSVTFSNYKNGQLNKLKGAEGAKKRKFSFENSAPGMGEFTTNGDTATLTGFVRNAAGQGFKLVINYTRVSDPGVYKNKRGASKDDWSFYTMASGSMTSVTDGIASFDLLMRGAKWRDGERKELAAQMGTGANNRNVDMLGLFTKFKAVEQGCDSAAESCESYNGKLKLTLSPGVPLPAAGAAGTIDGGDTAVVPLPATGVLLLAAFGALGGLGRRRKG